MPVSSFIIITFCFFSEKKRFGSGPLAYFYLHSRVVFMLLGETFSQKKLKSNSVSANPVLL